MSLKKGKGKSWKVKDRQFRYCYKADIWDFFFNLLHKFGRQDMLKTKVRTKIGHKVVNIFAPYVKKNKTTTTTWVCFDSKHISGSEHHQPTPEKVQMNGMKGSLTDECEHTEGQRGRLQSRTSFIMEQQQTQEPLNTAFLNVYSLIHMLIYFAYKCRIMIEKLKGI